ncbi:MAG: hypothetical protein EOP10_18255 [Proteobacteria bacterium]|nr:MAG: hypothetical protein EOP10_18255 [Pseudomonadota bacterium]
MKYSTLLSLALLTTTVACSNAEEVGFKGGVASKAISKAQDAKPEEAGNETPAPEAVPVEVATVAVVPVEIAGVPAVESEQSLQVKLSAPDVRAGAKNIQAEAVLAVPSDSKIIWSIEGAANTDLGQIDDKGKYTSPVKAAAAIKIYIVATLESDPSISGKKELQIIPEEQLFAGCKKGNLSFPISADVFQLAPNTAKLPDFSKMTKSDVVCLDKFDIATQNWERGFPGASALQEWFGLHAAAKIIIPKSGVYEFRAFTDDGSILYIDGKTVINHDGTHSPTAKDGSAELSLGKHDLVLDYFQGPRTQVALQLYWKVPGSSQFVIVPTENFSVN